MRDVVMEGECKKGGLIYCTPDKCLRLLWTMESLIVREEIV